MTGWHHSAKNSSLNQSTRRTRAARIVDGRIVRLGCGCSHVMRLGRARALGERARIGAHAQQRLVRDLAHHLARTLVDRSVNDVMRRRIDEDLIFVRVGKAHRAVERRRGRTCRRHGFRGRQFGRDRLCDGSGLRPRSEGLLGASGRRYGADGLHRNSLLPLLRLKSSPVFPFPGVRSQITRRRLTPC